MRLDDRSRWLIWLSLSEIGTMMVFSNYSALLPILQKEWSLTNGQAGWIFSSYQIGYILSVAFLISLTDYTHPKYIYIITALWADYTDYGTITRIRKHIGKEKNLRSFLEICVIKRAKGVFQSSQGWVLTVFFQISILIVVHFRTKFIRLDGERRERGCRATTIDARNVTKNLLPCSVLASMKPGR